MKKVDPKQSLPKMEEEILAYWKEQKIFEQSVKKESPKGDYVFYDGPPFATGTPHYGHIVASALKDAVPRYWTMRGYRVERTWGWDCHGLPIENIAEKALGVKSKKDIEEIGVEKFNEFCRSTVLQYTDDWKKVITRLGRWADMENPYKTMDLSYMESVWWVFKQLWDKGLIYESYRIMHICTRCETTLSQSEVSEGYMDVKDLSATVKFPIIPHYPANEQNKNCRLIVINRDGRILMGREKTHEDVYNFPGGHLKQGESWREAAKREAKEEMNVDIELLGAKFFGFWVDGKVRSVIVARVISGEVMETEEVGDFVWCTRQEIEERKESFHKVVQFAWKTYIEGKDITFEELEKIEPITVSMLAWTTTPWTLPGNVALAVGKDIEYARVKVEHEYFICAKSLVEKVFNGKEYVIDEVFLGDDFIGRRYLPLFNAYSKDETFENHSNGWKIYAGDFVTTDTGTGVVHIAPAFGEDDWSLAKQEKLPFVQHVRMDGTIKEEVKELAGMSVKPKEKPQATDVEVIKYLAGKNTLFSKEKYEHSYPHCWRCDTPLINYATSSWFVKVTDARVKDRALELAKNIEWSPQHIKEGRFGKWLEGARDWSISRQRFWASVLPIWKCERCAEVKVFGSAKELEAVSGATITDLHKHIVDTITFSCEKCAGQMKRVPDVLDTWFDSGSMPYAQGHYPFENQGKFEANFPAEFIAEGIDQTRAWFYYLHILGTALMDKPAFKNVVVNGIVQAEDGKKMSKRLNNYPDPSLMFDKYGADAMRLYLLSSPIVSAENLNFSEKEMGEMSRNVFRMLWNSYSFFVMYAEIDNWKSSGPRVSDEEGFGGRLKGINILDRWILSELQVLTAQVNANMEQYDIARATRLFAPFIDNLSNWYIRRSRKRFWKNENESDKKDAYQTLYDVLLTLAKLMAPFTPFIAEEIYRNLTGKKSVHLAEYPVVDEKLIDHNLNVAMSMVREVVSDGLQKRAEAKIKVRQPLQSIRVSGKFESFMGNEEHREIIKEELNVKEILFGDSSGESEEGVVLDTQITPELKLEGQSREVIRFVQELRKEAGFEVDDRIQVGYRGFERVFDTAELSALIIKEVLATKGIFQGSIVEADIVKETVIDDMKLEVWLKR